MNLILVDLEIEAPIIFINHANQELKELELRLGIKGVKVDTPNDISSVNE